MGRVHDNATVNIVALLKACAKQKDLCKGTRLHADILKSGLLERSRHVGNTLVSMYAKCGALPRAQQVLDELPARDVVTWSALISGFVQHGLALDALNCYDRMQREGFCPDAVTFVCILKACALAGAATKGKQIHDQIVRQGLLGTNVVLGNALVDMYAKCGAFLKAQEVLDGLLVRDVVTWNALITGYVQQGLGEEALHCFELMHHEGLCPDAVTFICILKACGLLRAAIKGKQVHDQIIRQGLLGTNLALATALVDMYAKCGELPKAQQVLDELPDRNVVTWSALIAGYAQHGHAEEALDCFDRMQHEGLSPDAVTFICILKACAVMGRATKGKQIHDLIIRQGLLGTNPALATALVDMYAKCGKPFKAQQVFDELPERNLVTWSALITGYVEHGHVEEALNCFEQMQHEGLCPDAVTYICILKACALVGAATKGKQIHGQIVRCGLLGTNVGLGNALVDMYAKCGELLKAQEVLNELPVRDVITWSALISGYAQHGHGEEALNCFKQMQHEGFRPNAVTFICVLDACSQSGLLDEAQKHFENMSVNFGIMPDVEHYTCMVDLFGRAGHFDKAIGMIEKMRSPDYLPAWDTLLGACQKWGYVELGKFAFEQALKLDKTDVAAHAL